MIINKKKENNNSKRKKSFLLKSYNRKTLLANTTDAEKAACQILTRHNITYIKQYPITTGRRTYYADIYIPRYRLVLEIDGGYHYTQTQQRKDTNRSAGMRRLGYHVYRLSNHDARIASRVLAKITQIKSKHRQS